MSDGDNCLLCQLQRSITAKFPEGEKFENRRVVSCGLASFVTGVMVGASDMANYMNGLCPKHATVMAASMAEYVAMTIQGRLRKAGVDVEIAGATGTAIPKPEEKKPTEPKKSAEIIPITRAPKKELN